MQRVIKKNKAFKLKGEEIFLNANRQNITVSDFWQYGYSNLNSNILRGVLAEFLVEYALNGKQNIGIRNPWQDFDVLGPNGLKVEVKSSSYLQDWDQKKHSTIVFSGLKAKSVWGGKVQADYKADVYVLVLVITKDPHKLNLLDLNQWQFYVMSRDLIRKAASDTSSVSLTRLNKLNIRPVGFKDLKQTILQYCK